jgi:tripartite-type tricarboxylate transporter receptor subunit TctC
MGIEGNRQFSFYLSFRMPSMHSSGHGENRRPLQWRCTAVQMRRTFVALLALVTIFGKVEPAAAQTYPSRPVTLIVPFPAGGPIDSTARIVAEGMRASLGQPVIIENVGGASGSIGTGRVARAAPDGYTLGIGYLGTHVFNGVTYPLSYDLLNDFEPVSPLVTNPLLIDAKKTMPAKDLLELIAWLKANPGKASQGTSGVGGTSDIAGIFFQKKTGTRFQLVPYSGAAAMMRDLLAGQIDLMIDFAANSLPQVRAGAIKAYAVTAPSRLPAAPEIPTVDEAGLPGFYISAWQGFWVPKGTPKELISKLDAAVVDALADPSVRRRLADLGQEIYPRDQQTPQALGALQRAEIAKWWPIIKAAGIKAE